MVARRGFARAARGRGGVRRQRDIGNITIHRLEAGAVAASDRDPGDLAEVDQNFTDIEPGRAGNDETGHQRLRDANARSISNSASSSEDLSPRATAARR